MPYDIIVGRTVSDKKKFGDSGTIFLGRHYVKMGQTVSLSSNIRMDVARAHVVLISGKRGSGKSYTLGVMAEEMSSLPEEVSKNLGILMFDTMGIFWTMKYANQKEEVLLAGWNEVPTKLDTVDVFTPIGYVDQYKKKKIPVDFPFSIKTSELDSGDWANIFNLNLMEPVGILIEKTIGQLHQKRI